MLDRLLLKPIDKVYPIYLNEVNMDPKETRRDVYPGSTELRNYLAVQDLKFK